MATWWNSDTLLRLDRAVCTPSWVDIFNHARVLHLAPSDSDHVPHPECDGVVKEAWGTDVSGTPMFCVTKKVMHTRIHLNKWQEEVFKGRQLQMLGIRARLEELLSVFPSMSVQNEKKELTDKLQSLLCQEELFWKQR
ncbi:uncharacterized protein LOC133725083 [Rosa rugosa]|uniref:uncharacterized protein LOC133725083 n=1 Tax=Rosa rugosa TaxID=74645 RepID=UPI002B410286|nr:uncharacterized protein LOC133725083 [Rosa rugosa]